MELEILRGPASYIPTENHRSSARFGATPRTTGWEGHKARLTLEKPLPPSPIQVERARKPHDVFQVFSNKEASILVRTDHLEKMDGIRRYFNKRRVHIGQSITNSDILNAALDFVFDYRIPFEGLQDADGLKTFIQEHIRRNEIYRWKQFNEVF